MVDTKARIAASTDLHVQVERWVAADETAMLSPFGLG